LWGQREKTPPKNPTPEVAGETVALAERIQTVGQSLIAANPFLGLQPNFYVLTTREKSIGHPDSFGVFLSEPMILACQTKEDLATVLALELATMVIEQKNIARLGLPDPTAALIQGDDHSLNIAADPNAKVVAISKPRENEASGETPVDLAKRILVAAGFGTEKVDIWQPEIAKIKAGADPSRTLGGSAVAPSWTR
jgi:hypothetical protein